MSGTRSVALFFSLLKFTATGTISLLLVYVASSESRRMDVIKLFSNTLHPLEIAGTASAVHSYWMAMSESFCFYLLFVSPLRMIPVLGTLGSVSHVFGAITDLTTFHRRTGLLHAPRQQSYIQQCPNDGDPGRRQRKAGSRANLTYHQRCVFVCLVFSLAHHLGTLLRNNCFPLAEKVPCAVKSNREK